MSSFFFRCHIIIFYLFFRIGPSDRFSQIVWPLGYLGSRHGPYNSEHSRLNRFWGVAQLVFNFGVEADFGVCCLPCLAWCVAMCANSGLRGVILNMQHRTHHAWVAFWLIGACGTMMQPGMWGPGPWFLYDASVPHGPCNQPRRPMVHAMLHIQDHTP